VKAIARAGAGTNNIPVRAMSERGVPVFNAPGANANAVKELVLTGMLLAARNLPQALRFVAGLDPSMADMDRAVEDGKKAFAGYELAGQTLGVIGLGKVGCLVADAAIKLGMNVLGYDPEITVDAAWSLPAQVKKALSVSEVLRNAHFVTLHVPLVDATRHLLNDDNVGLMRPDTVLLNFSRDGVVDDHAVIAALQRKQLGWYVCDFPSGRIHGHERVVAMPHLGASTREAEENCALMVVDQLRDFLEHGNVSNSVNFPAGGDGARVGIPAARSPTPTCPTCWGRSPPRWRAPASTSTTWSTSRAATWRTRWSTSTARSAPTCSPTSRPSTACWRHATCRPRPEASTPHAHGRQAHPRGPRPLTRHPPARGQRHPRLGHAAEEPLRRTGLAGRTLGVFLPRGASVRGGDVLVAEDGSLIRVVATRQAVLVVRACAEHGSPFDLLRAAYHLGNRHVPLELQPDRLQLEPDHVLAEMLRRMHLVVTEEQAPFEPETGAYGDTGNAHAHGHQDHGGHQHDDHRGHAHGHDHADHEHRHGHRHTHDHDD
jgi:D-3-phosphoglycerate dehydrogenase